MGRERFNRSLYEWTRIAVADLEEYAQRGVPIQLVNKEAFETAAQRAEKRRAANAENLARAIRETAASIEGTCSAINENEPEEVTLGIAKTRRLLELLLQAGAEFHHEQAPRIIVAPKE